MRSKILFLLGITYLGFGCSTFETSISALCEKDHAGNYTIKWEVFPEKDDAVIEIYASDNDTVFPSLPIKKMNANKFIAIIEDSDSLNYAYFKLKVGDTYSPVITNRFYDFNEVVNFRDIGGYKNNEGRTIKWGKIFRSGEFYKMTQEDEAAIEALGIESVVDLRSKRSQRARRDKIDAANRYELYVEGTTNDSISEEVLWNRFLRGDAIIYMQDMYEAMLLKQSTEFAKFFDLLTDEKNYPLVFHCSMGKDQSGIAAYFLLRALDVSSEQGEDDYMLSNIGIKKSKIVAGASEMTESQQEAFTMLTRTDISYLRYGLGCVKKAEGSVDNYMVNRLGLTKEKREKLREILLY